jgi:2-haloacid dehalogenase
MCASMDTSLMGIDITAVCKAAAIQWAATIDEPATDRCGEVEVRLVQYLDQGAALVDAVDDGGAVHHRSGRPVAARQPGSCKRLRRRRARRCENAATQLRPSSSTSIGEAPARQLRRCGQARQIDAAPIRGSLGDLSLQRALRRVNKRPAIVGHKTHVGEAAVKQIDCVVFDVGNVLVRWDPRNLYRRMGHSDVETASILAEIGLLQINHRALDAGEPFTATLEVLIKRFPRRAIFIRAFDERWVELLGGASPATVAILKALKEAGVPVHAISNYNREKFDIARGLYPFLDAFDELILSGDVRMVKPDPEIFKLLIRRRDLDVRRTVFIDDSADNVAIADRLGFATSTSTRRLPTSALSFCAWACQQK